MNFSIKDFLLLGSFPVVMSLGQLLFRQSATGHKSSGIKELALSLARNPSFLAALVLYAIATLLWVWLLSRYSLSIAYPFAATAIVIVPLLECFVFGVRLTPLYWVGLFIIMIGVVVVVRAQSTS